MDYLPRLVEPRLRQALASMPVVLLDGPRASGKTTTARRFATSAVLLPRDLPALSVDPDGYLASLEPPVLIDDWQLAGVELLWAIKRIVDEASEPGRFLLTGSVEPATYGPTYPLTGRVARVVLRPMSRLELSGQGSDPGFLAPVVAGQRPSSTAGRASEFDLGWLVRSGFPGARGLSDQSFVLDAYATTVSERAGAEGRDASRLLRTLRVLAALEGQVVPDQRIWEAADVNKVTWKAYDDLLQRVHVAVPLPAFESNRLKRLTSYPKRFLADTALALALAGLDEAQLAAEPHVAGHYLESFVLQQLRPQVDAVQGHLTHLRTGAGEREVNAVVEVGRDLFGFEVKHGVRPSEKDALPLAWLRDRWGERLRAGFVVHTGGDAYPLGERLWAIPVDALAVPAS